MIIIWLIILGTCLGSFINATVWRIHQQSLPKKQRKASASELSIVKGRSMCSQCQHPLAPSDLIPIVSWVFLRGHCRYCHKPIEDGPVIELLVPVLFVASYLVWPYSFDAAGVALFVTWLGALVLLAALAMYDLRWMLLPDRLTLPLGILALVGGLVVTALQGDAMHISGMAMGAAVGGGFFYCLYQLSQGRWIGGGDVKLGFVLGLLVASGMKSLMILFIASLIGTLISAPLIMTGRLTKKTRIPFGPLLIVATVIAMLWGDAVYGWYIGTFLGL